MKITGYYLEYYKNNTFIGCMAIKEKDRETIGYAGKKKHIAENSIRIKKKVIKKGEEYMTIMYPYQSK